MVVQSTLTELGDYTLRVTVEYADPAVQPAPAMLAAPMALGTTNTVAAGTATGPYAQRLPPPNMPPPTLAHPLATTINNNPPLCQAPMPVPRADASVPPKARALLGAPLATVLGAVPGSDPLGASALTGGPPRRSSHAQPQPATQAQQSQPLQLQLQAPQQPQPPPMRNNQQQQTASGANAALAPAPRIMRKYYRFKVMNTER